MTTKSPRLGTNKNQNAYIMETKSMKRILYTVCGAGQISVARVLEEAERLGIQLPDPYQQLAHMVAAQV